MASHSVVYPRMGPKRELKLAQESFWDGKSSVGDLQKVAADLSVEFIVPELGPDVKFSYASHTGVAEYKEAKAGVTAFGFDLVRGTKTLDLIKGDFPEGKYLFAGVVDGRNIWANDLAASLSTLETLEGIVGKDKLVVSTSCSLLHRGLFVIEESKGDRDPIDNTEDEIGISPPAISRSPIPKTMRVKIMVNSHEYIALIDTGSNLNFLHPRVAREVGLRIINDNPICEGKA